MPNQVNYCYSKLILNLYLLISISTLVCSAQTNNIDSLQVLLSQTQGEQRFQILDQLIEATVDVNTDLALMYSKEAIVLAKKLGKTKLEASSYVWYSYVLLNIDNFDSAKYYIQKGLKMALQANDTVQIAKAYNVMGVFHHYMSDLHSALYNYLLSYNVATKVNDTYSLLEVSSNLSIVFNQLGDYNRALKFAVKANKLSESSYDVKQQIWAKTVLAGIYSSTGNFKQEEKLLKSIIELTESIDEMKARAVALTALGKLYTKLHRTIEAKQNLYKGIELYSELKNEYSKSYVYSQLGDLYLNHQPDSAIYFFRKSQALSNKQNITDDKLYIYEKLFLFFQLKNMQDSILLYQSKYIEMKKNEEQLDNVRTIDAVLAKVAEEENFRQLLIEQSKLQKKATQFKVAITISLLLLILLYISYRYYRSKQRINELLQTKNSEISAKNGQLEVLNKEKNKLIGIVAHDLRSPLNSVKGLVNITRIEEDEAEKERYMDLITTSTDRMADMVNRILDVSALESKTLNLRMEKVDLVDLINQLMINFRINAQKKNQDLEFVLNCESAHVEIDKNYFIQVLENLLSNAIKYSPNAAEIKLLLECDAQKLKLCVQDKGQGISQEEQKNLFKEFTTLSSKTTDGEKATGLGLSIVKKYVEAMNGRIWCESEVGVGSKFIIQFELV